MSIKHCQEFISSYSEFDTHLACYNKFLMNCPLLGYRLSLYQRPGIGYDPSRQRNAQLQWMEHIFCFNLASHAGFFYGLL